MRRGRKLLSLTTVIVTAVTVLCAIAFYQHLQVYYRMWGVHHEVIRDFQGYSVVYAAYEYESDTLPPDWYMPDRLGICEVIEHGQGGFLQIVDAREEEPLQLQIEQPVFKYKDKFYQISPHWVTPALPEPWWTRGNGSILTGVGMMLILVLITLITEWRKALRSSSNAFGIEPPP